MTFRLIHLAAATPSLLALAAAFPAAAQDEGTPWSGWYVGANIGANWGDSSTRATVASGGGPISIPPADIDLINAAGGKGNNKTGFTGGVEGGFNYQTGNILLGIETEFSALDVNQRHTENFVSAIPLSGAIYQLNQRAKTSWMWTLRPRLGYVAGPWLIYATGGLATSKIKSSLDFSDNRTPQNRISSSDSKTKTGWIAGAGAGYALDANWSVKGEWLYADFGSISTTFVSPGGFVALTSKAKVRSNLIRLGVDYRF